jgi:uncharacterized protein
MVGLLCAKKDIIEEDILYLSDELNDFKGGMIENYICCQLVSNGYSCFWWLSDRGAEADFIIQREGKIIPIEAKSASATCTARTIKNWLPFVFSPVLAMDRTPLKILLNISPAVSLLVVKN